MSLGAGQQGKGQERPPAGIVAPNKRARHSSASMDEKSHTALNSGRGLFFWLDLAKMFAVLRQFARFEL